MKRFEIALPGGDQFTVTARTFIAISADAKHLVYVANQQLYLRAIDQLKATVIPGTTGATSPFFSPDWQWIGFWQSGQLKKMAVTGGASLTLCKAVNPFGVSWGQDETITFGQGPQGVSQIPSGGGEPKVIIAVDSKKGESAYGPQLLPGGRLVLLTVASPASQSSTEASQPGIKPTSSSNRWTRGSERR